MNGTVHIVGAGLAGLSTAIRLTSAGRSVQLYEAAPHAGGRCRTFWDPRLERNVDNGNHLVLSGNRSVCAYLKLIGATQALQPAAEANFPFVDLTQGARWSVRLNNGPVPWWMAAPGRRIPGTRLRDYLRGIALALTGPGRTVAEVVHDRGPLWTRFWEPMTLAVLNTTPERGAARLLQRVLAETFLRGAHHCRPMFAPKGLGTALVTPALDRLDAQKVPLRYDCALKALDLEGRRVTGLRFTEGRHIELGSEDRVVLALPPTRLKAVMPGLDLPADDASILNAHYVVEHPERLVGKPALLGLVGARTHWIFVRGDVVSLTISAADKLDVMGLAPDELIPELWSETTKALGLEDLAYRSARINKERRATFDQSPEGAAKRPDARTTLENLYLAGDATRTGLPATIEGAVRSGETAARLAA